MLSRSCHSLRLTFFPPLQPLSAAFTPEYANPGAIQDASLTSPEAQIINSPTIIGLLNGLMSMIDVGLNACYGGLGMRTVRKFHDLQFSISQERVSFLGLPISFFII